MRLPRESIKQKEEKAGVHDHPRNRQRVELTKETYFVIYRPHFNSKRI